MVGVKNLNKNELEYHGGNTKTKSIDHDHEHHSHAHHRKANPNEGDVIAEIFTPVARALHQRDANKVARGASANRSR